MCNMLDSSLCAVLYTVSCVCVHQFVRERERGWGGGWGGGWESGLVRLGWFRGSESASMHVLDTTLRYVCRFAFNIWYDMHYMCALVDEMR